MERIMVVGTSCAGKTTLARRIARTLDMPHVELDALYWGPNWSECPTDEFRERVRERVGGDRWVVDGNYAKARDVVLSRARPGASHRGKSCSAETGRHSRRRSSAGIRFRSGWYRLIIDAVERTVSSSASVRVRGFV